MVAMAENSNALFARDVGMSVASIAAGGANGLLLLASLCVIAN